jgi:hypothetical protein
VIPLSSGGKVRERLTVSKQIMHGFHMERFDLRKLKKVRIAALEIF